MNEVKFIAAYDSWVVTCPKHGEHPYVIRSNIKEHEGSWCQICWIESLGEPLPSEFKKVPLE
jgi:hypothetical protein